jgi:hypothetical protein
MKIMYLRFLRNSLRIKLKVAVVDGRSSKPQLLAWGKANVNRKKNVN